MNVMDDKNRIFEKKNCIIVACILVGLLIVGTFFDYQISSAVFNEQNIFGIILASYGQLPAMLCFSISGTLIIKISLSKTSFSRMIAIAGGVLLNILAVLGIMMDPMLYIEGMSLFVSLVIAIVIVLIVNFGIWKISEGADKKDMKTFICILLGTILVEIILINIIKIPWARPRMRMIATQPDAFFQPWWVIGNDMKDHLMALGVASEEFKSFPSGHTGNAACAILLGILPLIAHKLKGKETMLFFLGFAFACLVACSRIIMGAHFLSDVTIGLSVTFIISCMFVYKMIKKNKKED